VVPEGEDAPDYELDWDLAFRGGWPAPRATAPLGKALRRVPDSVRAPVVRMGTRFLVRARPVKARVVTKSVMCAFSLEWILARYDPPVVLVRRDPLNVVASLIEVGTTFEDMDRLYLRYRDPVVVESLVKPWGLPALPDDLDLVGRVAFWVGLNATAYHASAVRHGTFTIVDHDPLCGDPSVGFGRMCAQIGIEWNEAGEDYLRRSNTHGEGFSTNRITAFAPDRWKTTLSHREAELRETFSRFPGTLTGNE
jgi:hypothetical protein